MKAVIFDLDGTLVNSAPSILKSLKVAFTENDLEPNAPLTPNVIGPFLRETLARLCGDSPDSAKMERLARSFQNHYDTAGYRETVPFDGVDTMLRMVAQARVALFIATNKRALPTKLILKYLGWSGLFHGVYAFDTLQPPAPDKTALLARLLADAELSAEEAAYVGDLAEDAQAARVNRLRFFFAAWGFCSETETIGEDAILLGVPDAARLLSY